MSDYQTDWRGSPPAGGATPGRDDEPGTRERVQERVQEQVGQGAQVAADRAREGADRARGVLRRQVDERSTWAGDRLGGTAGDVRSVADELRRQGQDGPAKLVEQAAHHVDRAGGYLRDNDTDRFLDDVERLGRRNPLALAAAGLAAGFAASRFLRASSAKRYDEQQRTGGYRAVTGPTTATTGGTFDTAPRATEYPATVTGTTVTETTVADPGYATTGYATTVPTTTGTDLPVTTATTGRTDAWATPAGGRTLDDGPIDPDRRSSVFDAPGDPGDPDDHGLGDRPAGGLR